VVVFFLRGNCSLARRPFFSFIEKQVAPPLSVKKKKKKLPSAGPPQTPQKKDFGPWRRTPQLCDEAFSPISSPSFIFSSRRIFLLFSPLKRTALLISLRPSPGFFFLFFFGKKAGPAPVFLITLWLLKREFSLFSPESSQGRGLFYSGGRRHTIPFFPF